VHKIRDQTKAKTHGQPTIKISKGCCGEVKLWVVTAIPVKFRVFLRFEPCRLIRLSINILVEISASLPQTFCVLKKISKRLQKGGIFLKILYS
jgi:hypothetical protein